MEKLTDSVRRVIGEGDLEKALETLQNYLATEHIQLYNEIILQKASLSRNNLNIRQGTITQDDAFRIRTKINLAVLTLLLELEKTVADSNGGSDFFISEAGQSSRKRIKERKSRIVTDTESPELVLIGDMFKITAEAGHIFRPTPNSDWGIDGEIEFKDSEGKATGRRVYLQLKSGDSHLYRRKKDNNEIFTIKSSRHGKYWLNQPCPVLLVLRDSSGQIRWMNITKYLQLYGPNSKQIVFKGEPFTFDNMDLVKRIAKP